MKKWRKIFLENLFFPDNKKKKKIEKNSKKKGTANLIKCQGKLFIFSF